MSKVIILKFYETIYDTGMQQSEIADKCSNEHKNINPLSSDPPCQASKMASCPMTKPLLIIFTFI